MWRKHTTWAALLLGVLLGGKTSPGEPAHTQVEFSAGRILGEDLRIYARQVRVYLHVLPEGGPLTAPGWHLHLGGTVGFLDDQEADAWVLGAGPVAAWRPGWAPRLEFFGGVAPSFLTETRFNKIRSFYKLDMGSSIQFHSYLGLSFSLLDNLQLLASLEHISNAGLRSPNPGLDLALVGARLAF